MLRQRARPKNRVGFLAHMPVAEICVAYIGMGKQIFVLLLDSICVAKIYESILQDSMWRKNLSVNFSLTYAAVPFIGYSN